MPKKEGVLDLLNLLWEAKMPMAIATSTHRQFTEKYLSKSDLKKYFKYIVFEDSQNGILAAHRAGTIPILVKYIKYPDDEVRKLAFKEYETMNEIIKDIDLS